LHFSNYLFRDRFLLWQARGGRFGFLWVVKCMMRLHSSGGILFRGHEVSFCLSPPGDVLRLWWFIYQQILEFGFDLSVSVLDTSLVGLGINF